MKTKESGTRVAQKNIVWTDFDDRDIDKLFIKSGNRKDFKFLKILAESAFINEKALRDLGSEFVVIVSCGTGAPQESTCSLYWM